MELQNMYNEISRRVERYVGLSENDYTGADGLIYCGNCHTRKQSYITNPLTKETKAQFHMCDCKRKANEEERRREEQREFERYVEDLRRAGFDDSDLQSWVFAKDDRADARLSTAMHNYVDKFDDFEKIGQGLILFGNTGTGKTFAAACAANALIDKGVPCLMTSFPRIINILGGKYDGKQDYIDRLNNFRLLVIDDFNVERTTDYVNEIVYSIIDGRYRAKLPMILTTNLTAEELKNPDDIKRQRIYDRVLERCLPLEVNGESRRRKMLAAKNADIRKMLGIR